MAGVDLVSVREHLGYPDTETTMRYAHLAPGHLRDAVNRGSLTGTVTKAVTEEEEEEEEEPKQAMPPIVIWCARRDLNPQPSDPKSDALSN